MKKIDICRLFAAALLALAGCSLVPDYNRPPLPTPDSWPQGEAYSEFQIEAKALPDWNEFCLDPNLSRTVELGLANNRDLKVAALNVEKYRAAYRIERADLLPSVNAVAGANIQRVGADFSGTGDAERIEEYSVGLATTSYELDLFGRVRSLKGQALEEYLSSSEAQRATRSSLIAAIADIWLTLAADREQLDLASQTLESREKTLELVSKRFAAGVAAELDVQQARTTVESARVQKILYTRQVAQDENLLTLLVGTAVPVDLLPGRLTNDASLLQGVAPGLPAEVLLARPDILQAEHQLKAANANIGAARAAFFPRIVLTGTLGTASSELSGLFDGGSGVWSFVPQINLPIFTAGRNLAALDASVVARDIAIVQYEQAIRAGFREVADSLATRGTIDAQLTAQQALSKATDAGYRLSLARYEKGIDSYLSVLVAERALFSARQVLVSLRLQRLINQVSLYKALGGGAGGNL